MTPRQNQSCRRRKQRSMNKQYLKGRRFEYKVKKQLEAEGCLVIRSAGSHSVADLVAIKEGRTVLVQCKTGRVSAKEAGELVKVGAVYGVATMMVYKKGRDTVREGAV